MKTVIHTAPVKTPISLREAKIALRFAEGDMESDDLINSFINPVTNLVEEYLNRKLITQTWKFYLDDWPKKDFIELPFGKLQSITSIKYTNNSGVQSTMSSANYVVDIESDPGKVYLAYSKNWPSGLLNSTSGIEVIFVCGYGATSVNVPAPLKFVIGTLITELWTNRADVKIKEDSLLSNVLAGYKIHYL